MSSSINSKVVVLGGGGAGWLTALFLKRNWPGLTVTVVENPKRPPIIAGESGTTTFVSLLKHLKIDNNDFIRKVNATPKLGGRFKNWNGVGTEFVHSLQTDYAPWLEGWTDYHDAPMSLDLTFGSMNKILAGERSKDLYLKTLLGNNVEFSRAFYAYEFIKQNKVPFGSADASIPCIPMWHFESRSAAAYFKEIGLSRGIELVEGEYQTATQDANGNIVSISLDGERTLDGNWFFDCSGFARLLMGSVMKEPVVDYSLIFPARAVVAWWDEPCYSVCTNATAMKYGWSWNINLRHRSGNGYIYDPDHITLDQAVAEAEQEFGRKIDPIANFQFQPGMMRNFWRKNVFAVGLSSGFLEPLEGNGIHVIIESLYAIQDYWTPTTKDTRPEIVKRANDRIWLITEDIKDFLALHYRGHRRDTDFWRSHGEDDFRIPETLKPKLEEWQKFYQNTGPEPWPKGYSSAAWMMVLQGLQVYPPDAITADLKGLLDKGMYVLNMNEEKYKKLVEPYWTIEEWIDKTA
jgi:tryptophan halogenase